MLRYLVTMRVLGGIEQALHEKLGRKQKGSILYNKENDVLFELFTVTIALISQQQPKLT